MKDCNGKEIKLGDKIKISAEKSNDFLRGYYEDDLPEEALLTCDLSGTVTANEYGLIAVDKDGQIIWDSFHAVDETQDMLEIVEEEF